jgi:hypothetical protein
LAPRDDLYEKALTDIVLYYCIISLQFVLSDIFAMKSLSVLDTVPVIDRIERGDTQIRVSSMNKAAEEVTAYRKSPTMLLLCSDGRR